jgi:hypothetical protein
MRVGDHVRGRGFVTFRFQDVVVFNRRGMLGTTFDVVDFSEVTGGSHVASFHDRETAIRLAVATF